MLTHIGSKCGLHIQCGLLRWKTGFYSPKFLSECRGVVDMLFMGEHVCQLIPLCCIKHQRMQVQNSMRYFPVLEDLLLCKVATILVTNISTCVNRQYFKILLFSRFFYIILCLWWILMASQMLIRKMLPI